MGGVRAKGFICRGQRRRHGWQGGQVMGEADSHVSQLGAVSTAVGVQRWEAQRGGRRVRGWNRAVDGWNRAIDGGAFKVPAGP